LAGYLFNAVSTILCGPPLVAINDPDFHHYGIGHYGIQRITSAIEINEHLVRSYMFSGTDHKQQIMNKLHQVT